MISQTALRLCPPPNAIEYFSRTETAVLVFGNHVVEQW